MNIQEMIRRRAEALARGKTLLDTATNEKRDLTADEKSAYEAAVREAEGLQRQIDEAAVAAEQRAAGTQVDPAAAARAAISAERTRSNEIRKRVRIAGLPDEVADDLIARDVTLDHVGNLIVDEMAKRGSNATRPAGSLSIGFDSTDPVEIRSAMSDAIVARASRNRPQGERVEMSERGRAFANHSLLDMFADIARARGERIEQRLPPAALYDRIVQIRALSTSDFPILLADSGNKILVKAYQLAQPTYRYIFARKTFNDFKPHKFDRAGDFPNLLEKGEKGEFQFGAMGEAKQELTLATYGRVIGLSRRMLINDDLGAFADVPAKAGRRVADFENSLCWAQFALNSADGPTITETTRPVFNTTDLTKSGTSDAISVTSVGAGRAAMMKKTSIDGLKLNVAPRYLVTSPDKFTIAEQFCSVNIVPAQDSNANPFKGRLTPVGDANLSGNAWFLMADPADLEVFVYGYLNGAEGPQLMTRDGFTTDGVDLRISLDFVAGAIDFRGGWKNTGA